MTNRLAGARVSGADIAFAEAQGRIRRLIRGEPQVFPRRVQENTSASIQKRTNTPTIFDASVAEAITDSAEAPSEIESAGIGLRESGSSEAPRPPKDPMGDLDPQKAWDFTFAGAANGLWKAFLAGEKINKAIEGWRQADESIRPHATRILDWLQRFVSSSDTMPPSPPTIGV